MFDIAIQISIALTGGAAIWLVSRLEHWKRWGYIIGMIGQPAWFYATIASEQWGIFVLSLWYTYAWGQGIYNYWIKKEA